MTDGALRFFEVSRTGDMIKPKSYGSLPFPRLYMGSRGGKSDGSMPEGIAALKAFAVERGYQAVRVLVHEGDAYVFKLRVPTLSVAEIGPAIESALEENIPVPPADALFEYGVISVDRIRSETIVAVSVVSEKMVSEYLKIFESSSLVPISFETESRAIARALIRPDDQAVRAVISIKARHSVIFVAEGDKVTFSSSVEVGSSDLSRAVEKAFGAPLQKQPIDGELFSAMLPVFAILQGELDKVIAYSKTEAKRTSRGDADGGIEDIEEVLLSGSDARIPGFARYISLASKVPVRVGSVWVNILSLDKEVPALDEKSSLDYDSLIGAHL